MCSKCLEREIGASQGISADSFDMVILYAGVLYALNDN